MKIRKRGRTGFSPAPLWTGSLLFLVASVAQKTPAYWIWIDAWPLTGSGKIQKFKLAEAFAAGEHTPLTA